MQSTIDHLKRRFRKLEEKFLDCTPYKFKVGLIHKKHQIGKFANLINPNHRHDEEHEKKTDEKRVRIAEAHRFNSFAPERPYNNVKWYVDGRDYFYAVSVALERAQETIYIADWWLSPELFLRRPPYFNQEWRLDQVLKRRAENGVKIFVTVYREVEAALTCNSSHTKHALRDLCPKGTKGHGNIVIMRHPDHNVLENAADMTFYWAHHEKFIVIDCNVAFIGGLDLCFGRWDNHQHPLADLHPKGIRHEIWPGQDFNNNRVMDFQKVDQWKSNMLSKTEYGRMPWHDVSMGIVGDCVTDIAEHFILRWNFIKRDKYKRDSRYDWLILDSRKGSEEDLIGVQRPKHPVGNYILHPKTPLNGKRHQIPLGTVQAQIVRSSSDWSSGILTEHSIQNAYSELIRKAEHYIYIENQFFITATAENQTPIKNTIGAAIVDAVVRASKEGRTFRVIAVIPAIPGFAGDLRDSSAMGTRAIMDYQYKSICRGENSIFEQIRAQGVDPNKYIFFFNLRCYDRLNATSVIKKQEEESGVNYQEIQQAHAQEIMDTDTHDGNHKTRVIRHRKKANDDRRGKKNIIAKQKFEAKGEEFGFNKAPLGSDSVSKNAMLDTPSLIDENWEGDSQEEVENWIQEELYVHGKVLIIDDKTVVCGSSNINDRSQLGTHDSELSIVMTDTKTISTVMDGRPYEAGYHAATLRRYLWREHLGLLPPQGLDAKNDPNAQPPDVALNPVEDSYFNFVADPLSIDLWEMWKDRATRNTEIFRQLFHADPDDCVKTFEDYETFLPRRDTKSGHIYDKTTSSSEIRAKLDQIKGHLVWMPLEFLKDAQMAEPGLQMNSWTESIYT
ncbi:hypothetical protein K3495_g5696 [Podosphaera aphanis]|nr:hypothetical protein K3495_g5696 [Podosphaera aphanis]